MGINLSVKIGKIVLKNPVTVCSGTFGNGEEYKELVDIATLGALITKTITVKPREGNPPPRITETPAGILNSIGLENRGVKFFIREKLPFLKQLGIPFIVSIAGHTKDEFKTLAAELEASNVKALELNISCPNIKYRKRGLQFSQDAKAAYELVRAVRKSTRLTLITKLSPNVTDITEIARAVEDAGSDALSLINTLAGMSVDIDKRMPKLGNITGGLSGPAIKPIALKMVWETYKSVRIPIIGMGGIMDRTDALEFLIAGARAIAVGTANFINPKASREILEGIKNYMKEKKIHNINTIIGSLQCQTMH
ncbi:MAG: dihydroorotate dehydrogenase [Candidatus Omnitrophota bacterium]